MKKILVYSDSISWVLKPGTREYLPTTKRWSEIDGVQLDEKGQSSLGKGLSEELIRLKICS